MGWRGSKKPVAQGFATVALSILFSVISKLKTLSESFQITWFTYLILVDPFRDSRNSLGQVLTMIPMCHFWWANPPMEKDQTLSFAECLNVYDFWRIEQQDFVVDVEWKNLQSPNSILCPSTSLVNPASVARRGCIQVLKLVPWILACPVWFCKTFAWNLIRRGKNLSIHDEGILDQGR